MFTIREEDRTLFLEALEKKNNCYNEIWKCPTSKLGAANYHTRLAFCDVHSTRDAFSYASLLMMTGREEDARRAYDVLWHACSLQDKNPANATYGIWSWYMEEPLEKMAPPDWNWADFCGKEILQVMIHHADRVPYALYRELEETLKHACLSIFRRNIKWDYTNISIMGSYVTILGGQVLNWPWMSEYGKKRFERFVEETRRNGAFAEYNSATYTTVAIEDLTRLRSDVNDPEIVALAEEMLDVAWKTVADHFHAPTKQWCGPNARSYTWLTTPGTLSFLEHSLQHTVKLAGDNFQYNPGWAYLDLNCPEKYRDAFAECESRDCILTFTSSPGIDSVSEKRATFHGEESFAMSSWNVCSTWNQRRNLLSFWGGNKPRFINATILHNFYDFSSGMYVTSQERGHAIAIASLVTDGGDTHCNLDMIQKETIHAYDLRVRLELGGAYESEWALEGDTATLHDGGITVCVKLLDAEFDGMKMGFEITHPADDLEKVEAHTDLHRRIPAGEERSYLDIVWYAGEDREIKLDQIQSAYAAIAISMDGTSIDETKVFLDEELISVTCGNLTAKASKRPQKNKNWIYQA